MGNKVWKLLSVAFIAIFASISTCFAKELTLDEVSDEVLKVDENAGYYYNIGQYVFTSNHILTLEDVMLAARTIVVSLNSGGTNSDAIYKEMATFQFDAKYDEDFNIIGFEYIDNFTGEVTPDDKLDVCYINYTNICGEDELNKPTNNVGRPEEGTLSDITYEILNVDPYAGYFYNIGQYVFTSNHILTLEDAMLAARTIEVTPDAGATNKDSIYNEMVTYQFDAVYDEDFEFEEFSYSSNFTGEGTPSDNFKICYINYNKICSDAILVDVDALVNDAYNTIKNQGATDKFEINKEGNTIYVVITNKNITSIDAIAGTGIATAATNMLDAEGIKSITLTYEDLSVEISNAWTDIVNIANFFYNVAGTENATALKGKTITATVSFEEGYETANSNSFNVSFDTNIPAEVTTTITDANVGETQEFEVTTTANDYNGKMVIGTSDFSNPEAIEKLEYYEVKDGKWYELTGDFGPAQGFPLSDATSKFRVTWKTAGEYTYTIKIVDASDRSKVYAETTETIVIKEVIAKVSNQAELEAALANENIKEIVLVDSFEVDKSILVSRDVTIDGKTPEYNPNGDNFVLKVYGGNPTIKNVTLTNAMAAIMVGDNATVTVENVNVDGNVWGGIEVKNVETASLIVESITHNNEVYGTPTVWVDAKESIANIEFEEAKAVDFVKEDGTEQVHYYTNVH